MRVRCRSIQALMSFQILPRHWIRQVRYVILRKIVCLHPLGTMYGLSGLAILQEGTSYDAINKTVSADEYYKSCVSVKIENDKKQHSLYSSSLLEIFQNLIDRKRDDLTDDENGNLLLYCGSVIYTKNNSYRVINYIDGGTFGQTYKCRHVVSGQLVAIKVVRSLPQFYEQGNNEYLALKWISDQPRNNTNFIIYLLDYTILHSHHVFVFPLYAFSLYHVIRLNSQGLSLHVIRNIAYEVSYVLFIQCRHYKLSPFFINMALSIQM